MIPTALFAAWRFERHWASRRRLHNLARFTRRVAAAVCAVDREGRLIAESPALLSLFGRHPTTLADMLPPTIAQWQQSTDKNRGDDSPAAWLHAPDGSRRQIRCTEFFDAGAQPPLWRLLYFRDVTEAEAALEQNRQWRIGLQGARLGLLHIDPAAREIRASAETLSSMLGLGADWCVVSFEQWLSRVHEDDRAPLEALFFQPDLQRDRISIEYRFRHQHGHWEWLEQRHHFIDEGPRHDTLLGLCSVISARKLAELEIHRREHEFRMLAENSVDVIARYDLELRCQYINRSITRYTPEPREAHIGRQPYQHTWPEDAIVRFEQACLTVIREQRPERHELELELGGRHYIFETRLFPELDGDGRLTSLLCIWREITDLRQSSRLLEEENAVLEMIAGNRPLADIVDQLCLMLETQLPGALCSVMQREDTMLELVAAPSLPPALHKMLNHIEIAAGNGACGAAAFAKEPVIVEDIASHPAWQPLATTFGLRACWSFPILNSERDLLGTFAVYFRELAAPGQDALRMINRCSHIAAIAMQRDRHESQLYVLATQDGMTRLSNRRHFLELAEIELRHARRYRQDLTVLMLDLDHFKAINDHYGHATGDRVIVDFADRCRRVLRSSDLIGRLGGEEFAALLPSSGLDDALRAAERLRLDIESGPHEPGADMIPYRVSIGVACWQTQDTLDTLLNRADRQLYQAKQQGRNRVCWDAES